MADGIVHDVTDIGEADAEESGEPDATQPTEPDVTIIADTGSPSDLPTSSETSETLALPEGLAAEAPPANKPLSDFAGVLDTTGTPFSGDQLLGSWTVIWFYPLALTAG